MADSLGQKWKNREFNLSSVSNLSSDASSASPGIARFTSDGLQIQSESQQIPLNFDLQTAQVHFQFSPYFLSYCNLNSIDILW